MISPQHSRAFAALAVGCLAASQEACSEKAAPPSEAVGSTTDEGPIEVTLERLPELEQPPASVRMKVRFASSDLTSGIRELADTGFGAVEWGADLNDAAGLATTLRAAKEAGLAVDLAPGGSMPYAVAGIGEADSMQQLSRAVSELLTSDGTTRYHSAPPRPSNTQRRVQRSSSSL